MNEPLKNKEICPFADRYPCKCNDKTRNAYHHFNIVKVKSAVEWLKEQINKYPNIQLTHMKLKVLIDNAFPDLCPSGDLPKNPQIFRTRKVIADKQNPHKNICKKCGKDFQIYGNIDTMICDDCNAD